MSHDAELLEQLRAQIVMLRVQLAEVAESHNLAVENCEQLAGENRRLWGQLFDVQLDRDLLAARAQHLQAAGGRLAEILAGAQPADAQAAEQVKRLLDAWNSVR